MDPSQHSMLQREAKYYLLLPNGYCISAYKLLRTRELLNQNTDDITIAQELEALNYQQISKGVVRVNNPLPSIGSVFSQMRQQQGWKIYSDLPNFQTITIKTVLSDKWIESQRGVFLKGPFNQSNLSPGDTLTGDYLVWPIGTVNVANRKRECFRVLYLKNLTPTPQMLAFAVKQGKAKIQLFSYLRSAVQPYRTTEHHSGGLVWKERIPTGPRKITYEWESKIVDLRFREDNSDFTELQNDSGEKRDSQKQPKRQTKLQPTHKVVFYDGRELSGILLEETHATIRFHLIVGTIETVMEFSKTAIDKIVKLSDKSSSDNIKK